MAGNGGGGRSNATVGSRPVVFRRRSVCGGTSLPARKQGQPVSVRQNARAAYRPESRREGAQGLMLVVGSVQPWGI